MSKINHNVKGRVSGLRAWEAKLQDNYGGSFESFEAYCNTYNLHSRLGYESAEDAWEDNPIIQGSTDPRDYTNVTHGYNAYEREQSGLNFTTVWEM